jgi:acyl carrier protein
VELGEIAAALRQHGAVRDAVVVTREVAGTTQAVGYVVADGTVTGQALRRYLRGHLPGYMVPAVIVPLPALPLTPNGKLDLAALPSFEHDHTGSDGSWTPPRTPTERQVVEIWQQVLGLQQISIDDDFFELGGHSLLAIQVNTRIRDAFGLELPLRSLFEYPMPSALAEYIDTLQWAGQGDGALSIAIGDLREEGEL